MTRTFARSFLTSAFVLSSLGVAMAGALEEGIAASEKYDFTKALELLEPLAKEGNPRAQVILGHMSKNGWGLKQDSEAARKWYLTAAEQGNAEAQYLYGLMLEFAQGGPKDMPGMVRWHTLSASRGYNKAMRAMGIMHHIGLGVEEDFVQSYMWYSLALSHGMEVERSLKSVANRLTAEQIAEAQQLARQWKPAKD